VSEAFNLVDGELEDERPEPAGFRWRAARLGPKLGGTMIGATLYELEPGERSFPYHYEYGCEEWLLCVSGTPTLRTPDGERELRAGDVVAFPEGPSGAHQVHNAGAEPARVLIWSTKAFPAVAVYPDSGKIGVWLRDTEDSVIVRRESNVDYWDGEL
jgi:uncharacterized cupin superfamily protein